MSKKTLLFVSLLIISSFTYIINFTYALMVNTNISSYGTIVYQPENNPNQFWLHTEGSEIRNSDDQIVHLKGVAWMDLTWRTTLRPESLPAIRAVQMKQLGVNLVRLTVNWNIWKDPTTRNQYIDTVDQCINELKKQNIYVEFDFHGSVDYPVNLPAVIADPTDYFDWWNEITTRYINESHVVIYGLWNEPNQIEGPVSETDLYNIILEAAQRIHAVNPNVICTVPTLGYDFISNIYYNDPLPEPNMIYVWHRYYYWDSGQTYYQSYQAGNFELAKQQMEDFYYQIALKMLDKNLPIFHEEFGARTSDPAWDQQLTDLFTLMNKYNISYNVWAWFANTPYSLIESDWQSLSPQGQVLAQEFS